MLTFTQLENISNVLRVDALKMTTKAGSGHPTTCLSCAEIISVLFFKEMQYETKDALNDDNDEFVLSKGHAAPILYSALFRAGCIKEDIMALRRLDSPLEGHPLPGKIKWVKVATGSLGQGLSVGVGMAIAAKLKNKAYRTYVLLGDGESAEGSVFEAFELASKYSLSNLCAIIDVNRLGQSGETMLGHNLEAYRKRFESFGWDAIVVDGHEVRQLIDAFAAARKNNKPTVIIAKTVKGKGVSFIEDREGWHGKPLSEDQLSLALDELPRPTMPKFEIEKPKQVEFKIRKEDVPINVDYKIGSDISTREAYGNALAKLSIINSLVVATDGDVKNSTYAEKLLKINPKRFIEAYIAEQNMIGLALGLSIKGFDVFASSFACFLTRAHDQIRMAALSDANLTIVGSHAGVSIGQDGPSQMGLEDIPMYRCLPNSIVVYPSDGVSAEKLTEECLKHNGIKYIRTTREKTKVIYDNKEKFLLGDFKVVKKSKNDKAVIIGAGITLHEALKAYELLKKQKVEVAVIDCYSIKPFNHKKLLEFAKKAGNKVIVVEDHYPEGGIGEMIASGLSGSGILVQPLAVATKPHSAKPAELMKAAHIDSEAIADEVIKLIKQGKK